MVERVAGFRERRSHLPLLVLVLVLGAAFSLLAEGAALPAHAEEVGPFGPPLGVKADVVRSFSLKTSGAVTKEVKGARGDGKTGLVGQCNPTMFANFGIEHGGPFDAEQTGIALVTEDPIATGATGTFELSKVYVRFFEDASGERSFGGRGTLTLTVHQASARNRRMTGTVTGRKLQGLEGLKGKTLDVLASFDMEFSCGVR